MTSKRAKACDIPASVKEAVWERDGGRCVLCGNRVNVMPNAHYISRTRGGLGIEQNIVTLCTSLTANQCHYRYDNGSKEERADIRERLRGYLQSCYPDWDESKLFYHK